MKYKVGIHFVGFFAALALPFLVYSQTKPASGKGTELAAQKKNYAIIPKLPPAPKPEPFTVSTIPLPENVISSILVNYLPDGKHLIMEVRLAGSTKDDIAVMKDDGSGFKVLTL